MSPRRLGLPFMLWAGATTIAAPALRLMLRSRLRRDKELPGRLPERRGIERQPRPDGTMIWLHAASVGETLSLLPLLAALCRLDPALHLLLTTGTVNAQRLLAQRLEQDGLADRVRHRFVPLDVPRWIGRFLNHWQPDVAALVESELWPNLVAGCVRRGIPLALLNARMSERSGRLWRHGRFATRPLLAAFTWITARSEQDAARFRALGAVSVEHDGDLKRAAAALPVDADELARLRSLIGDRPVWLAASTHEGEEAAAGRLHHKLVAAHPALLTVVAPRHPDRGAAVAATLDAAPRRSAGEDPGPETGMWVADTLGELGLLYRLAGIVLLGNSLDVVRPGGGHNPLEPARLGCAIAVGPRAQNFDEDVQRLQAAGALAQVADDTGLGDWLERMLTRPDARQAMADAALAQADEAAGLAERLATRLLGLLPARSA